MTNTLLVLLPILLLVLVAIHAMAIAALTGEQGPLKRGVLLFVEPLSQATQSYLQQLEPEALEPIMMDTVWERKQVGFMRRRSDELLISGHLPGWQRTWPLIGYVNLKQPSSTLEFRTAGGIFLLPICLTIAAIAMLVTGAATRWVGGGSMLLLLAPIGLLIVMILNFQQEKSKLRRLLKIKVEEAYTRESGLQNKEMNN